MEIGNWLLEVRTGRTGVCVGISGLEVTVEFRFLPDGSSSEVCAFDQRHLSLIRDPIGLTVWQKKGDGWVSHQVVGAAGDYLALERGATQVPVLRSDLVLLDRTRIPDVAGFMSQLMTAEKGEMKVRRKFRNWYNDQLRFSNGYPSFLTTIVRPSRHQLDVLARVMNDPIRRFVLADEVGLGKTIEAGLIIREFLLEQPNSKVRIFVPPSLEGQWRDELESKVRLGKYLDRSLFLCTFRDLNSDSFEDTELIVVDEVHRICEALEPDHIFYEDLQKWTRNTKSVIFLTATPYRSDVGTFLRTMNLIDPAAYPLDAQHEFEMRLDQRVKHANWVESLTPSIPLDFATVFLANVMADLPDDPELAELATQIERGAAKGELLPGLVEDARLILEERHRIGRRVIRTRRGSSTISNFFVRGRQSDVRDLDDSGRVTCDEIFDEWREYAISNGTRVDPVVFQLLLQGLLDGPNSFATILENRLQSINSGHGVQWETEPAFIINALKRISKIDSRCESFLRSIDPEISKEKGEKIVIAATDSTVAQNLYEKLVARYGENTVVCHIAGLSDLDSREAVETFSKQRSCRIFVMDWSAEEGCNLQAANRLINYDLPLSLSRLEQRIGRVDRYSEGLLRKANCEVLVEKSSEWVCGYQDFLREAIGILDNSVATVQRELMFIVADLIQRLISHGPEGFYQDVNQIRDRIDKERIRIEKIEHVESMDGSGEFTDELHNQLIDFDECWSDSQNIVDGMTDLRVGYAISRRQVVEGQPILTYRLTGEIASSPIFEPIWRSRMPERCTSNRLTARRDSKIRILRRGDGFVELINSQMKIDQRGRFEIRHQYAPELFEPLVWFEFEIVENLQASSDISDPQVSRRHTRFLNALMPPRVEILTINDRGEIIENPNEIDGVNVATETRVTGGEIAFLEAFVDFSKFAVEGPLKVNEFIAARFHESLPDLESRLKSMSKRRARIFELRGDITSSIAEGKDLELMTKSLRNPFQRIESCRLYVRSNELIS